jgi:glucose-1-phosphate adenylyltransferase
MKIVALVLAGGEGCRLYPLTAEHAKPALPFANGFRIVDFVLSNLVNSRVSTIYVLAQYKPASLVAHIETAWAPWFAGAQGSIKVLLPRSNTLGGQYKGTADAVYQHLDLLQAHAPDAVAVFAADHIYRMDVRQMAAFHASRDAEATVAAAAVPIAHASSFGVLGTAADGRIREFREKPRYPACIPARPGHAYASMGNYLFQPEVLERWLQEARRLGDTDFGRDVLPRVAGRARLYAYDFSSNHVPGVQEHEEHAYWRDVGTLSALAAAQQDAMGLRPRFNLWNRRWPIRGEHDATLLARLRDWKERTVASAEQERAEARAPSDAATPVPAWRAAGTDRRSDERLLPS